MGKDALPPAGGGWVQRSILSGRLAFRSAVQLRKRRTMDEQKKVLFAEIYRNVSEIKHLLKDISKQADIIVLTDEDWDNLYKRTQDIAGSVELITGDCRQIYRALDTYIAGGPYNGATAQKTPLESMADE